MKNTASKFLLALGLVLCLAGGTKASECYSTGNYAGLPANASYWTNVLHAPYTLPSGTALIACDGGSTLEMHAGGDLVAYALYPYGNFTGCNGATPVTWEPSIFAGYVGSYCALWHTNTSGNSPQLMMRSDGFYGVYDNGGSGAPLWGGGWGYGATKMRFGVSLWLKSCYTDGVVTGSGIILGLFDDNTNGNCHGQASNEQNPPYAMYGNLKVQLWHFP